VLNISGHCQILNLAFCILPNGEEENLMNLFLLGVFIALALIVLGKNVPQIAKMRWLLAAVILAVFLVPSMGAWSQRAMWEF
jgi:hypothetical protein